MNCTSATDNGGRVKRTQRSDNFDNLGKLEIEVLGGTTELCPEREVHLAD